MEDSIFEPFERKLEAVASKVLADKSQAFDVELTFPAMMTKELLKKMLGCGNDEVERYVSTPGFPVVRAEGKQDRFPRDAVRDFLRYHWQDIA